MPVQSIKNATDVLTSISIKGGSTTAITIKLYRAFMQIPAAIPDSDPQLKRLIRNNIEAAKMNEQFVHDFSSRLSETVGNIDASLAILKGNKTTAQIYTQYFQLFTPLSVEAKERINERAELIKDIANYIKTQHGTIPQIIADLIAGKKPKTEINSMLDNIFKSRPDLLARAIKLDVNEKSLQAKLDELHVKVYRDLPVSERSNVMAPSALEEKAKTGLN